MANTAFHYPVLHVYPPTLSGYEELDLNRVQKEHSGETRCDLQLRRRIRSGSIQRHERESECEFQRQKAIPIQIQIQLRSYKRKWKTEFKLAEGGREREDSVVVCNLELLTRARERYMVLVFVCFELTHKNGVWE